jgi:hypothetical protein
MRLARSKYFNMLIMVRFDFLFYCLYPIVGESCNRDRHCESDAPNTAAFASTSGGLVPSTKGLMLRTWGLLRALTHSHADTRKDVWWLEVSSFCCFYERE